MSWKDYFLALQGTYNRWKLLGEEAEGDGPADATEMMQKHYPGRYIVIEKYDLDLGRFRLDLKFDSDEEQVLWLLKYS